MQLLVSQKISLYPNVFSCKEGRRGERESRREGERNRGEGRRGERKKKTQFRRAPSITGIYFIHQEAFSWVIFILSVAPPCGCQMAANSYRSHVSLFKEISSRSTWTFSPKSEKFSFSETPRKCLLMFY